MYQRHDSKSIRVLSILPRSHLDLFAKTQRTEAMASTFDASFLILLLILISPGLSQVTYSYDYTLQVPIMRTVPQMTEIRTTFKGLDGKMTTSTALKWIKSDASYFTAIPTATTVNGKPVSTTKTAYAEIITPTATASGKPTGDKTLVIAPVIGEALKKTYEQAGSGCLAGKRQACLLLKDGIEAELVDILKHYAVQLTKAALTDEVISAAAALVIIKGSLDAAKNVARTKGSNYNSISNQLSYPVPTETKKCPTTELSCNDSKCNGKDKKCTEVGYPSHEPDTEGMLTL